LHRHKLAVGIAVLGQLDLDTHIVAFWFTLVIII
jgi:hypothetical protein